MAPRAPPARGLSGRGPGDATRGGPRVRLAGFRRRGDVRDVSPVFCVRVALGGLFRAASWFTLAAGAVQAAEPLAREWMVDGVKREALVHFPAAAGSPAPLVFVFHGHGGTARNAARAFALHTHWAEAVVVYPQGLNTPGRLTDPEGRRAGWQHAPGDQGDRDLRFFDAMLAQLRREVAIDEARVYATGHSNGGGFTYLLWAKRGEVLAAVAPSAAVARDARGDLAPKPVLHLAGRRDELVRFAWQEETIRLLRRVNGTGDGAPWAADCTVYASKSGTPVVAFIHDGAHGFPRQAPALIVRFFRENRRP